MSVPVDRAQAEAMVERLRAMAQPQRLMILAVLLDGECAVGEIEARAGVGQPALSQQLGELRRAGLVATRREARLIHYRIADEDAEARVRTLFEACGDARPVLSRLQVVTSPRKRSNHLTGAAAFARIG